MTHFYFDGSQNDANKYILLFLCRKYLVNYSPYYIVLYFISIFIQTVKIFWMSNWLSLREYVIRYNRRNGPEDGIFIYGQGFVDLSPTKRAYGPTHVPNIVIYIFKSNKLSHNTTILDSWLIKIKSTQDCNPIYVNHIVRFVHTLREAFKTCRERKFLRYNLLQI